MKIISLTASNVKKLSVVEIEPKGNLIQITGRNGQGKSSVLDSIWWALGGTKGIQAQPVRTGEEQATIRLDLGDLIVTRKLGKGAGLVVENAEGARFQSPQNMLDALLGELTFDPLAFMKMKSTDQADELRRIAKLGPEIDELDQANAADYASRTEHNRKAKDARAAAASVALPDQVPDTRIDVAALIDQLQSASKTNSDIDARNVRREAAVENVVTLRQRADQITAGVDLEAATIAQKSLDAITDFEGQIAVLMARIETEKAGAERDIAELRVSRSDDAALLRKEADDLQNRLDTAPPLPDPVDVDDLRTKIAVAEVGNKALDLKSGHDSLVAAAEEAEKASAALTKAMDDRAAQKMAIIQAAEMPVAGLGLGDGVVLFNDIPLDQSSSAEQLRVSVAIAMAANPRLRILRIKEGSLLDEDGLTLLAGMADDQDFQIWMEKVDSSGKIGVVIEDGRVVADNQIETAAE